MRILFLISMFLLFSKEAHCDHIIGGEMYYECLGEGETENSRRYKISYRYYYLCGTVIGEESLIVLTYWNDGYKRVFPIYIDTMIVTEPLDYACLEIPEDLCIVQRSYSNEIELPISEDSYIFTSEDCCRTDLVNVLDASSAGVTYYTEILPEAQLLCNNNPVFQFVPPLVICVNEPINYFQDAIDLDGNQLVYEFYAPVGHAASPLGGVPPPPYDPLSFVLPDYAYNYPLGNGVLSLDANTGLLSGTPNIVGQFVIGICVSEYQNGVLLGSVRRDLQLNVAPCPPFVFAEIESDEISAEGLPVMNSCGEQNISFINNSTQADYIDNQIWSLDMGGNTVTSSEWEPSFFIEDGGSYEGSLILNPGGFCSDTANFILNVVPEIQADFSAEYDTCVSGPISFSNNSFSIGSEIESWFWSFDDNTTATFISPSKHFEEPGFHEVSLIVEDEFSCKDSVIKTVQWQPAPEVIIVSPDFSAGCFPLSVNFSNLSSPIDSTYQIFWNFGAGEGTSEVINPQYTYPEVGAYSVFVSVTSPIGCSVDTLFENLIMVELKPDAQFFYAPDVVTSLQPEISFTDNSARAVSWKWDFDGEDSLFLQSPTYLFADTGLHEVKLTVWDIYDCSDTLIKTIDIVPGVSFYLPNAFTPNGDGKNDLFKGKGIVDGMTNFNLNIWDRWGKMVFEASNPNEGWSGRLHNTGNLLPAGVYVYTLRYREPRGGQQELRGVVVLID